jgi:hypothetical protein
MGRKQGPFADERERESERETEEGRASSPVYAKRTDR